MSIINQVTTRRIALRLMYDGTGFYGWQRQPRGRTVQEELEKMLSRLCGDVPVHVVGAGRTDSGVHAHGQVAHAELITRYDDAALLHALRRMSPADLAVTALTSVSSEFHARYKACSRSYRYTIVRHPDPFLARYAWHHDRPLDIALLNAAAAAFLGAHDFTTFSKHNPDTPNALCRITHSEWTERDGRLEYNVTADRFLYGMVRLLVGMQVDVALGRCDVTEIESMIAARERNFQSASAPSTGLSLMDVGYPEEYNPWPRDAHT